MASVQDICNLALSHIGSDAVVSSISPPDGSVEAGHCARFYPMARRTMLELLQPGFARTRVALAEVANPSTVWAYAYAKPTSCIKPLRILQPNQALTVFTQDEVTLEADEGRGAPYDIEDSVILTNMPEAVMVYVRDVSDTTKFTPMMVMGLSYLMAGMLAGPIIKGSAGAETGRSLTKLGTDYLAGAGASDANASTTTEGGRIPALLQAR